MKVFSLFELFLILFTFYAIVESEGGKRSIILTQFSEFNITQYLS